MVILGVPGSYIGPDVADALAFVAAPIIGGIGGGWLGYRIGLNRKRRCANKSKGREEAT